MGEGGTLNTRVVLLPTDVTYHALASVSTSTHIEPYCDRAGRQLYRPEVSDPSIEDWQQPPDSALARCLA